MIHELCSLGKSLCGKGLMQLIYFVTDRCNCRCEHCFFWQELNKGHELSLDQIARASQGMPTFPYLLLSGGEPFLRNDIDEICRIFVKNNKTRYVVIPSNGTLTERMVEKVQSIAALGIKLFIYLSIDGIGQQHDDIRGLPGTYDKLVETHSALKRLQSGLPNLGIGVLLTMTQQNQDTIQDIYRTVLERFHPDSVYLNLVRGAPRNATVSDVDVEKYREAVALLEADHRARKIGWAGQHVSTMVSALSIETHKAVYATAAHGYQAPCAAARLNAVMRPNGDLYPCELLDDKLGNVTETPFDEIWHSAKTKAVRARIRHEHCFCTHECFISTSLMASPKRLLKLVKTARTIR